MARPVYAMLPPLILVACFLLCFQVSNCARPLHPEPEEQQPGRVPLAPHAARRDEPPRHTDDDAETSAITEDDGSRRARADDDGAAAAAQSMATAASPRDKGQDDAGVVGSGHRSALLLWLPVMLRSKFARRFLAGGGMVEGADTGARASCRSSDVHISCAPPSEH